tara:strand:- start:4055 stop:5485 length:1431 start_codon:yes stop_codon:yes gene_type:complete
MYFLSMVEVWERFGFYSIRGLLVLYLTKVFLFSDDKAYALFGAFTALIWLTPVLGGYVADKLLGYRRALIIGGTILTLGYALMAIPNTELFYFSLSLILVGNGFFKSSIASLVGTLYDGPNDPRRDGGFTIYYMGINIGGLIAPLVAGAIAVAYGWNAGFACASIGMLLGLLLFLWGQKMLGHRGAVPEPAKLKQKIFPGLSYSNAVYLGATVIAFLGYYLLYHVSLANYVLELIGAAIVVFYLLASFRQSHGDRNKMLGCLILIAFSIGFWVLYQQAPMTVNLFTERNVDRHLFGFTIPTVWFQALNPFFIIIATPFMNYLWSSTARSRFVIPTSLKFTAGILLMGLGFLVLVWASKLASNNGFVSGWWVVLSYGLQSVGELALSPIGLSMMTAMAPPRMSGMMVGTWFLASAASNAIAGVVAKIAGLPSTDITRTQALDIYSHAFSVYGWAAIAVGVGALLLVPLLRKMMGEHQ